jgi:hypothetical protein
VFSSTTRKTWEEKGTCPVTAEDFVCAREQAASAGNKARPMQKRRRRAKILLEKEMILGEGGLYNGTSFKVSKFQDFKDKGVSSFEVSSEDGGGRATPNRPLKRAAVSWSRLPSTSCRA